ncbi:MAG: class I SAM-dependent methyltransferase [Elusimicrobia bacterium]|nr:class I SAM-dependent methyltransferase [Elusimicrobiota bacterium]
MTTTIRAVEPKWKGAYGEGRAKDYDQFIRLGAMNYDGVLDAVLRMVMTPPERILELGAGTGLLSERLLERFPRASLTAVDGSGEMLERARGRLARFAGRVRVLQRSFEDFTASRFEDEGFDLIVSSFSLHHMRHDLLRGTYAQMRKSLAPRGQVLIADYVLTPHAEVQQRYEDIWVDTRVENVRAALGKVLDRAQVKRDHERTKAAEGDNPARLDDQLAWLRAAGFEAVDCHWKHFCYAVFGGLKPAPRPEAAKPRIPCY